MTDHSAMRSALAVAFRELFKRDGSVPELQCAGAVAWLETTNGMGWKPPGVGSFNLGAMQAGSSWRGAVFSYTDTHPMPDGTNKSYTTTFRKYPDLEAGAKDFLRVLYQSRDRGLTVLPAASRGLTMAFSTALHESGYYEGFGLTVGLRIAHHHDAVVKAIKMIAAALHEPLPKDMLADTDPAPVEHNTLRKGSPLTGSVRYLQSLLPGCPVDGDFGKITDGFVKAFQRAAGLDDDGVVGPLTWRELEEGQIR